MANDLNAMMLLVKNIIERIDSLDAKINKFHTNGISQLKRDLDVLTVSLEQLSSSLNKHLDWHSENDKKSKVLVVIIAFVLGSLVTEIGPAIKDLLLHLIGLL